MSTKTKRTRSSDPLPADVLMTLPELDIDVDRISDDEAWAICPGHESLLKRRDHNASWSINLNTGRHNCFSCGFGGYFIDLVQWQLGWDKKRDGEEKAKAWIRKHGGIGVARARLHGDSAFKRKVAKEVNESDLVFYDDPPAYARKSRDLTLETCHSYGLLYDLEKDRWIIPIRDPFDGHLMGWQEKGDGFFRNHPEHVEKARALYGYSLLKGQKTAYLEESPLDASRLYTYSLDGAVSGYGVHVSDLQLDLIVDEVDTLYVCLDNDAAGRAKEKEIWRTHRGRVRLFFANYDQTDKKDHGEMTPEEIEWSLSHAISGLRFRP